MVVGDDEESDVMVHVDRNKLSQVIHNLLSNAIKFTPPRGRVTVVATVEPESPIPGSSKSISRRLSTIGPAGIIRVSESTVAATTVGYVKVTITDTGAGLTRVRLRATRRRIIADDMEKSVYM